MNITILIILVFSVLISTIVCILIFNQRRDKWLALGTAFLINTLLLSLSTVVLYKVDVQTFHKDANGWFGGLGILVLVFFIPIITCVNFYVLEYFRGKAIRSASL